MTPPTARVLADPRVRLAAGATALLVTAVLAGTRRRGREPTGLGYLSGHAG